MGGKGRPGHGGLAAGAAAIALVLLGGCGGDSGEEAPAAAQEIFDEEPYASARWGYRVEDLDGGDPSIAAGDDLMVGTGSSAKLFTLGTVYEDLGPRRRLETPVYELDGDLVLVGSGDLALGGRNALEGRFDFEPIDKVYANEIPGAALPPGDPLAGLEDLARQVADAGIESVGDVRVDDRLFEPFEAQGGTVTPVFVNDNQVNVVMTPTRPGRPVEVETFPETDLFEIEVDVKTVPGEGEGDTAGQQIQVEQDPDEPSSATISGSLERGAEPAVRALVVPDPAAFARALFIAELSEAGVEVEASADAPNRLDGLPDVDSYGDSAARKVAALSSPELGVLGTMILSTSYNDGANTMLCLLAVEAGSQTCTDGLTTINDLIAAADGVDPAEVALLDGQGGDPASVTPRAMNAWLAWSQDRPWGPVLADGLPILGETGVLAVVGQDSPARGKVAAKTATSVHPLPPDGRIFVLSEGLAGFLETEEGRKVFSVYVSGGLFDDFNGLFEVGEDVAAVAAAFQQDPEG